MDQGARAAGNDVIDDIDAAGVVVEINAPSEMRRFPVTRGIAAEAENIVEEIIADDGAAQS